MTWIYDDNGRRWVDPEPRKIRKPARAIRFENIKVGDQLVQRYNAPMSRAHDFFYIVTDLWFDPVLGDEDPLKGAMVGLRRLDHNGEPTGRKQSTTKRGLASQQYHYAKIDYIAMCKARAVEMGGKVVGIGMGTVIRKRPKLPGL